MLPILLLAIILPGCEHDTGAELTEATVVYERFMNADTKILSATIRPREETRSWFGPETHFVEDAEVTFNFEPAEFDPHAAAYTHDIPDFDPGSSFDLSVTFDGHETYRYGDMVHDLELDGFPDYTFIYVGRIYTLRWTSPSETLAGSLEIRTLNGSVAPIFHDGSGTIYWTVEEELTNKDLEVIFTVTEPLPSRYGFTDMLMKYRYRLIARAVPQG